MELSLPVALLLLLLFILLSAFFSGSETALTHSRRSKLQVLHQEGNLGAKSAEELLSNPDRMLSAILLGNNFVNFAASSLATAVMVAAFGEAGIIYATVVMTAIVVMFAEVLPKTIAVIHAESLACYAAPWLQRFGLILSPFIYLMLMSVHAFKRLMGIPISRKAGLNRQELAALVSMSANNGYLDASHQKMLSGNLNLSQIPVKALMTPRNNMLLLDAAAPFAKSRALVLDSPYSRYPVYLDRKDNILGTAHLRDILSQCESSNTTLANMQENNIIREAYYIPNNQNAMAQLFCFQQRKEHMAIVVDEYGDIEGLITLEDILESIVGEIQDESDATPSQNIQARAGHWAVARTTSLHDINQALSSSLPEDRATTIGGLIVSKLGKQPDGDLSMHVRDVYMDLKWNQKQGIHEIVLRKTQPSAVKERA